MSKKKMRVFLVDHDYGTALVVAESEEEARFQCDHEGMVRVVRPVDFPLTINLRREPVEGYFEVRGIVTFGVEDLGEALVALQVAEE